MISRRKINDSEIDNKINNLEVKKRTKKPI